MGQSPACRTVVGDRGPDERTAIRESHPASSGTERAPAAAPPASRQPVAVHRPVALAPLGCLAVPLLLGIAACTPSGSGATMLDAPTPRLDGAPGSGRHMNDAAGGPGDPADPRLASMVDTLARDRELISQGRLGGANRDASSAPAAGTPATATARSPRSADRAGAAAADAAADAADSPPPPRWNQGGTTIPAAAAEQRDLGYDIEPPSLTTTGDRRRAAGEDDRPPRDRASRLADAIVGVLDEEQDDGDDRADADTDAGWLDATPRARADRGGTDRPRTPTADRPTLASPERSLPPDPVAVARADLMLALLVDAIDHPEHALTNALVSALGTIGDADAEVDPSMFRHVPEAERDLVEAFIDFARALTPAIDPAVAAGDTAPAAASAAAADPPPPLDRDALLAAIDELRSRVARTPQLEIQRAALCRQVDGFGVFEPLSSPHRFLAGAPNAFIVYLEVDEFHSEQRDGRDWVTELEQRIQIYNDRDARPVWATEWSEVVDVNANRRRDFFTAQIIELPDAFSLGVFHLKMQVRDRLTGAEAETSVEFEMVAGGSGLPIR